VVFGEETSVDALNIVRWLIAVPLGLFGVWAMVCNYACIALWLFRGEHHSLVPLVGGVCVALAWLLCPAMGGRVCAWIPLALDPGCLLMLLASVSYFAVMSLRGYNAERAAAPDRPRE
jgi:hypothetical protein